MRGNSTNQRSVTSSPHTWKFQVVRGLAGLFQPAASPLREFFLYKLRRTCRERRSLTGSPALCFGEISEMSPRPFQSQASLAGPLPVTNQDWLFRLRYDFFIVVFLTIVGQLNSFPLLESLEVQRTAPIHLLSDSGLCPLPPRGRRALQHQKPKEPYCKCQPIKLLCLPHSV